MLFSFLALTSFMHSAYTNLETVRIAVLFAEEFEDIEIFDLVRNVFNYL